MKPTKSKIRKGKEAIKETTNNEKGKVVNQETLTSLLVGLIVTGGIPIAIVANPFFITLMGLVAPWYKIPSRKTMMAKIQKKYAVAVKLLKGKLIGQKIALTFDLATVLNSTRQFLVISGHYVDRCFKRLVSLTLGVRQMLQRSDHKSIQTQLTSVLELHGLGVDQVTRVATDGGSNVKKAVSSMFGEAAQSPCVCHMINLLVEYAFDQSQIISLLLKDIKAVVTYFKMSPVAMNMLKNTQSELGKKIFVLIQAVSTRWNSQLNCIKRFVKLHSEVNSVLNNANLKRCSKSSPPKPVPEEVIPILVDVITLLQPLEEMTRAFSANKNATSSLVLIYLRDVHQKLTELEVATNVTADFRQLLTSKLGSLIQKLDEDITLSCAQLVDPRLKGSLLSETSKARAVLKVKQMVAESSSGVALQATEDQPPVKRPRLSPQTSEVSLLSRLRKKHSASISCEPSTSESHLDEFLQSSVIPYDEDPLQYWLSSESEQFVTLKDTALTLLLTPASSVASERIVSSVNFILRDSRSSLTSKNLNAIVALRSYPLELWSQIIGIDVSKTKEEC